MREKLIKAGAPRELFVVTTTDSIDADENKRWWRTQLEIVYWRTHRGANQ